MAEQKDSSFHKYYTNVLTYSTYLFKTNLEDHDDIIILYCLRRYWYGIPENL